MLHHALRHLVERFPWKWHLNVGGGAQQKHHNVNTVTGDSWILRGAELVLLVRAVEEGVRSALTPRLTSEHIILFSALIMYCHFPFISQPSAIRHVLPCEPSFLSPPRAYILRVFTQGGINPFVRFLAISGPPLIFKALMFGCLMHLPKQLAITGLREILPARFSPVFCNVSGSRKKIKYPFEASPRCLLGRCFL